MEAVKIPQDITIEDRIIGPITLRQLFMLLGGGGVSYVLWTVFKKAGSVGFGPAAIALTPLLITAAFAFVRINGITLVRFLFLLAEMAEKPPVRTWRPRRGVDLDPTRLTPKKIEEKREKKDGAAKSTGSIDELTTLLDANPLAASPPQAAPAVTGVDTIARTQPGQTEPVPPPVVRDVQPPQPPPPHPPEQIPHA